MTPGGTDGLDYFVARYDSSSLGRFMTPDWSAKVEPVPYAKLADPQSLDLYTYTTDNPLTVTDPSGHGILYICLPCALAAARDAAGALSLKLVGGAGEEWAAMATGIGSVDLGASATGAVTVSRSGVSVSAQAGIEGKVESALGNPIAHATLLTVKVPTIKNGKSQPFHPKIEGPSAGWSGKHGEVSVSSKGEIEAGATVSGAGAVAGLYVAVDTSKLKSAAHDLQAWKVGEGGNVKSKKECTGPNACGPFPPK